MRIYLISWMFLLMGCYDPLYGRPLDSTALADGTALPADVEAVFAASCAGGGCHVGGAVAPNLTYDSIVGVDSSAGAVYVEPSDLDASYLYAKLAGTQAGLGGGGSAMPLGSTLSADDQEVIATWITDGALAAE